MCIIPGFTTKEKKKKDIFFSCYCFFKKLFFNIFYYFKFIFVATLPGILTDNPSFYWLQKEDSLGTQNGSNPLFSIYSHII